MTNDNVRYRFKFSKGDNVKFIGHLDLVVAFQRALKRAEIPIAYSNGFNPHQLVAFALPLSLGYTSTGEYGDFQLPYEADACEMKQKINAVLPDGMYISELVKLRSGVKNTMASVCAASYSIFFDYDITPNDIEVNLEKYLGQESIFVMKKTKNNTKETDIRPDIISAENDSVNNNGIIKVLVNAGSIKNLKPDLVAESFCGYINKEYNKYKVSYRRNDMFMKDAEGQLISLIDGVGEY
ncbi:TIGR03936 family radical SAM-associated protein [Lachnospiraceae bacterium NSJ-143]|nr:TIGR03936 family radical SAM-associated protein [Lachnospiraceae bacterium NSJ-143]